MNEKGDSLAGATVTVCRIKLATTTDENSYFILAEVEDNAMLLVGSVG